jgi:ubiquinol-cytochrome c reductase cytochrome c1 subunit
MPHALWEYQGDQVLQVTERMDPNTGDTLRTGKLVLDRPGTMSRGQYDQYVADLVNFLSYMAEPAQTSRKQLGILVTFFLAGFFVLTLLLKKEFWKDVK